MLIGLAVLGLFVLWLFKTFVVLMSMPCKSNVGFFCCVLASIPIEAAVFWGLVALLGLHR